MIIGGVEYSEIIITKDKTLEAVLVLEDNKEQELVAAITDDDEILHLKGYNIKFIQKKD